MALIEKIDCNAMIGHKSFFDQSVTFEDIREITIGQGDDYRTGRV